MLELYNQVCRECSKHITQRYSTSFSSGIRVFDTKYQMPIYGIYGFVRFADEIVDTFHSQDKASLLERFRKDTILAIEEGISLNPVLHAFQEVVRQYSIEWELIEAFLESMKMDLDNAEYNEEGYKAYIYGSAEVVGLMCLRVFCEGNNEQYESLKAPACSLGAAFQKINFLRDIKSDFDERGRVYFPGVDFNRFSNEDKLSIEADIKKDFDDAYQGIIRLPKGARLGVYIAYVYYTQLFKKIKKANPTKVASQRIRVPTSQKIFLLFTSTLKNSLNIL